MGPARPDARREQFDAVSPKCCQHSRSTAQHGFAVADALIAALGRGGLSDTDRLSAFHAVFALIVGAVQAELAGPFTRGRDAGDAAARIGSAAGAAHPHVEALSHVARELSVEDDFAQGLRMLLDGIALRGTAPTANPAR